RHRNVTGVQTCALPILPKATTAVINSREPYVPPKKSNPVRLRPIIGKPYNHKNNCKSTGVPRTIFVYKLAIPFNILKSDILINTTKRPIKDPIKTVVNDKTIVTMVQSKNVGIHSHTRLKSIFIELPIIIFLPLFYFKKFINKYKKSLALYLSTSILDYSYRTTLMYLCAT